MIAAARWLRLAALAAWVLQFALLDLVLGHPTLRVWVPSALVSGSLWFAASFVRGRGARVIVALFVAWLLVVQVIFFRYYHVFVDDDAIGAARHMWGDARPILVRVLPYASVATLVVGAVQFAWLRALPRLPRRAIGASAIGAFALLLGPALRMGTPDVRAMWSLRLLLRTPEARAAADVHIPALPSRRERLPNVLFVLTESVRASDYHEGDAPETSALTRGRVDLAEMRSVASYTAIAVSTLLTSRLPNEPKKSLALAPYTFDFVHAVRRDTERPHVAYWSAQTDSLFERADVRAAMDSFSTAEDLVGHPVEDVDDVVEQDIDRLLAAKVERDLPGFARPFFVTLHLAGTHVPYYVDEARAPYRPYRHTPTWSTLPELHNAYRDAILAQDASVARMLRAFFATVGSEPFVVFFTSDHGEAFGEHLAIHHGQSLYDEQTHVPGWMLAGNGAISNEELARLHEHADEVVTHLDVLPTLLDVYGVLDAFPMAAYAKTFAGRSLLGHAPALAAIPMTNCTDMFPCPVHTWGVLGTAHELTAQPWDYEWHCVDVRSAREAALEECTDLRAASRTWFPFLPDGQPN